jgi:hypothetical protein
MTTREKPEQLSTEWNVEMQRWADAVVRRSENRDDLSALEEMTEIGIRLGFFRPPLSAAPKATSAGNESC